MSRVARRDFPMFLFPTQAKEGLVWATSRWRVKRGFFAGAGDTRGLSLSDCWNG
jgi:hypothetical protein